MTVCYLIESNSAGAWHGSQDPKRKVAWMTLNERTFIETNQNHGGTWPLSSAAYVSAARSIDDEEHLQL